MKISARRATAVLAATCALAGPALASPAQADTEVKQVTVNETIDLSGSSIYSDAPVPGAMTAGQFTIANESGYSLPQGYAVEVNWHVTKAAKTEGLHPGHQSYVSTTATPSRASSAVRWSGATNASEGKDGAATATVARTLAPGEGIYGTWSGATISADGESTSGMRYQVSVTAPSRTMTYTSTANESDGSLVEITHVVTIKGGTWSFDQAL